MPSDGAGASRALMVYLEPTPYVLALVRHVASRAPTPVDALFVAKNVSQPWNLPLEGISARHLSEGAFAALREIAGALRSGKYGLVHLAGWGHPLLLVAMMLAWVKGIPVAIESDSTVQRRQSWPRRAAKRLAYPMLFRVPAIFLPGGTRQKRYLMRYGVPETRMVVAQMTVDIVEVVNKVSAEGRPSRRAGMGVEPEHCLFLYVGRLEPPKDIAGLLEAFAELSRQSERAHLCMVGDGTLRPMVESAASRLPRLHYLGRLSGESLWDTYAAADVLVLPSVFEPWGLVINEAMAIGLPVIASDRVGCVEDLVVDGRTGIVVEAGSRVSLASAMLRLAEDANARASMGEAARRHIAPWTIEAEAGIVVDAWRRVARA